MTDETDKDQPEQGEAEQPVEENPGARCWLYSSQSPEGTLFTGSQAIHQALEQGWVESPADLPEGDDDGEGNSGGDDAGGDPAGGDGSAAAGDGGAAAGGSQGKAGRGRKRS